MRLKVTLLMIVSFLETVRNFLKKSNQSCECNIEVTLNNQKILLNYKSIILTLHDTELIKNHNCVYEGRVISKDFQDIHHNIYFVFII